MLPRRLEDASLESQFLQEFRLEGLRSTAYAGCVAVVGYLLIWAIDLHFNGWSGAAAIRRTIVIGLLCLMVGWVRFRPEQVLRNYSTLLGSLVLSAYVSSVTVTHLFRQDDPTTNVNPTAIFGLWIVYGFIRLPLQVAIPICLVGSFLALFGSRVTNVSDPTVRTAVYLFLANILGITHARHVEVRERELFLKRRTLEAAEEELRERSVAAEVASAEKTRLIAAVGHDLRQPMMAASLYLSVLEGRMAARDERGAEKQLANVQESLRALGDTLEHLLTAARYETGNYPLRMETVSLHELLSRVLETCGAGATARGVSLVVRRPEDAVQVRTDRQTALLVLTNLVSNAVKFADYSKPRPRVVIRRVRRGGQCQITVLDNGIGIAATDLERIWRPFFQVSNSERNREAGMGLGLYLVQRAVAQLPQHEVSVRSILGHGTMFRLTVPIVAGDVGEASAQSARPVPAGSLAGTYVLIVEDDVQARDALQAILRDWGADYASGATLDDAMLGAHGTGRHVDVLLVDYRLPNGVRGDQVIREARERLGYEACAVLVTAEAHQADSLEDCLPSATKLLRKPFSTSALAFALSEADRSSA